MLDSAAPADAVAPLVLAQARSGMNLSANPLLQ